jgi:hypothetical protein
MIYQKTLIFHMAAVFFTLCVFQFAVTPAQGAELVTGNFSSASGTRIVMNLSIASPAPSNLIVEQYISPQNSIKSTNPRAKKISGQSGKIKWLFRNIQPGTISLETELNSPLKGQVKGFIRYRTPGSGQYTEQVVLP